MKSRTCWFAGLCWVFAACSEGTAPPSGPQTLILSGVVSDSTGNPVEGVLVASLLWSEDSATSASGSVPWGVSDASGAFLLQSDSVERGLVDSVLFQTVAPGCERRRVNTVLPGSALNESGIQDVAITQPGIAPGASSQSDLICAYGIHPFWGPLSYLFALRFDVPGSPIQQGGGISTISSLPETTRLSGWAQTTTLYNWILQAIPGRPACTSMRLYADIDSNGDVGPYASCCSGRVCTGPDAFFFVEDTTVAVP